MAHLFLSGPDEDIIFGNFIADHIKGNHLQHLTDEVKNGIRLHRAIDTFTDSHPVTLTGKIRLREYVNKYAPVALDIIYDHYLAKNWLHFSDEELPVFLERSYRILDGRKAEMPEKAQYMYTYMRRDNWLGNYIHPEGILRALTGLSRRTTFESHLEKGFDAMMKDYNLFDEEFKLFFPELQEHAKDFLASIKS
ncbi:MAG: acyl carrier protein phosphodiesterase [Bacteroidota bacterium]